MPPHFLCDKGAEPVAEGLPQQVDHHAALHHHPGLCSVLLYPLIARICWCVVVESLKCAGKILVLSLSLFTEVLWIR